jgi:hypothetical protein
VLGLTSAHLWFTVFLSRLRSNQLTQVMKVNIFTYDFIDNLSSLFTRTGFLTDWFRQNDIQVGIPVRINDAANSLVSAP